MTGRHADLGAELLALAETVLARMEPILRKASAAQADRVPQGCSWCPVCALAALVRGEQHELLDLVATEGTVVIAALRQLLADHATQSSAHTDAGPTTDAAAAPSDTDVDGPSTEAPAPSAMPGAPNAEGGRSGEFVPIAVHIRDRPSEQ